MNRLYASRRMPTMTGFKAEHRLAAEGQRVDAVAVAHQRLAMARTAPQRSWTAEQQKFLHARCWTI